MKLFLLAALAILAFARAGKVVEPEHDYMYFPDGDGIPHLIDLKQEPEDLNYVLRNVDTIVFTLYTQSNPTDGQVLALDAIDTVISSNWDSSRPTRFITHGWHSDPNSGSCAGVRDAYLNVGDYNVIIIDWSSIANSLYVSASANVKKVAARVSEFIDFMSQNAGLDVSTTTLIGHSLGAHVVGIAAQGASETIDAVVALDPALPLFNSAGVGSGIHQSDAAHVQVIHTNGGLLGLSRAVGDSDFYVNGGRSQPGCGLDLAGSCAHARSYEYFAESITNPTGFPGFVTRSTKLAAFKKRSEIYMGGPVLSTDASGSYSVTTGSSSPFALE